MALLSVISKINEIRESCDILLHARGIRVKGHKQVLDKLRVQSVLGQLACGIIPINEAVSYRESEKLTLTKRREQLQSWRQRTKVPILDQCLYQF